MGATLSTGPTVMKAVENFGNRLIFVATTSKKTKKNDSCQPLLKRKSVDQFSGKEVISGHPES